MSFLKFSAIFSFLAFTLISCNGEKPEPVWSELPNVTKLDSLKQTEFMPTLENSINAGKNSIYATTLLYAWDETRNELGTGIVTGPENSSDFLLLNSSRSFVNSLDPEDYTIDKKIEGPKITVRAFFNKTLPFPEKMDKLDQAINFGGTNVAAFGMRYSNPEIIHFTEIVYYRSDDEFVLRFTPEDERNEIILVKGFNAIKNLVEAMTITNELRESGKREMRDSSLAWKYVFNSEDLFSIPVIKFNIETFYKTIEEQTFKIAGTPYIIVKAYQRTGFILNETGAVVESEAEIETEATAAAPAEEPVKPHPKHMVFDKPFFIIVKKKDKANPYFVMKVENAELMEKK